MAQAHAFLPKFTIHIQGKEPPSEMIDQVIEIIVEDNLYLPDMFTIRLHDPKLQWVDSDLFEIGNEVKITAKSPSAQVSAAKKAETLIIGEITSLEPDIAKEGVSMMVIRGYDLSHRLHQGKQTRSFLQVTDSDLVAQIAGEVNLQVKVAGTQPIHEHVTQNNQTNMEFLRERAQLNGYQLYVEDKTLHFQPGDDQDKEITDPPILEWGINLIDFQPRLTAVHQVSEVEVRSWNPVTKEEIIGQASRSKSIPDVEGAALRDKAYKGSGKLVVSRVVRTQQEADQLAKAIHAEMSGDFIQAEGNGLGDPRIKVGKLVEVVGLGNRFSGKYFVTTATHIYQGEEGYETQFSIGGRRPETLTHLLQPSNHKNRSALGIIVGVVTQNKDPENMGRVKVRYPTVDGQNESSWARIASPMAGAERGFFYLPEIEDEVLVAFEQGEIDRPYVLGVLWNGKDRPPLPNSQVVSDGKVNQRILKSRSGHEIILDDSSGQEKIIIRDSTGNSQLIIEGKKVTIQAMAIDLQGSTEINIKAPKVNLN